MAGVTAETNLANQSNQLQQLQKNLTRRTQHACHHSCRGSRVGCAVL